MHARGERLIGRDREMAALDGALERAIDGRGAAVLISGDAGVGKTSVAEALAAAAQQAGLSVAWGTCSNTEAPAYWPWSQALRGLGTQLPLREGAGSRAELFAAVVGELTGACAGGPKIVVLEDMHWADVPSLSLLRFVVDSVAAFPFLLAVTLRDDPADLAPPAAAVIATLPASVTRLHLGGLDAVATAALMARVTGRPPDSGEAAEVHRRSGGNPFFVTEIVRFRELRGERGRVDLPPAVREILSRRVARLSQPAAALLEAAAVVGEPDLDDLAAMTGAASDEVVALLSEAVAARIVTQTRFSFRFAHALVREAIYEGLGPETRLRLHRTAALNLEQTGRGRPADLAAHWMQCAAAADRRRGAELARAAAREAMANLAYEQAVRYFGWALDGAPAEMSDADRLDLLAGLGEAEVLAGRLQAGRDTLRDAAQQALRAGRGDQAARALLAMGSGVGGFEVDLRDGLQESLLREALTLIAPGDSTTRAAALARLSLLSASGAPTDERARMAQSAIDMARRLGDSTVEVGALAALCDAIAGPDHVQQRLAAAGRMLELAAAAKSDLLVLLARRLRLVALLELGNLSAVDLEIAHYARVSERLRIPLFAWPVPIWRGMRAEMHGDHDAAWRFSEEAEDIGRLADSENGELMVFALRLAIARHRGTASELVPYVDEHMSYMREYPGVDCMLAALYTDAGDPARGRRHLRRMMAAGLDGIPRDSEWVEYLWMLGDASILLEEREAAREVRDRLRPYAELWAVDGIGGACFGQVSQQLARLDRFLDEAGAGGAAPSGAGAGESLAARPPAGRLENVPAPAGASLRRAGAVWAVRFDGVEASIPDTKGMADIAQLLMRPGRELSVLDLVELGGGPSSAGQGDAGPLLDARARSEYAGRLAEVEAALALARGDGDQGSLDALASEREFLAAELSRAFGLGGRGRLAGDRVERARKAVTMRVATAVRAVARAHPALANHLRVSIRTGRFCVYRPEHPVIWEVATRAPARSVGTPAVTSSRRS